MISPEEDSNLEAARAIAKEIADFRKECLASMHNEITKECDEVVESEYDPAQGNGRGPWWADGG
jgi:hypothetical protein